MAVTPMKFVTIVGHAGLREEVLAAVHKLGSMELKDTNGSLSGDEAGDGAAAARLRLGQTVQADLARIDRRLAEVNTCLSYIQRYSPIQKGLVESFLAAREGVDPQTWQAAGEYDYSGVLATCQRGETRLGEIRSRESELAARLKELEPLVQLTLDIGALEGTPRVAAFFGQAGVQRVDALARALAAAESPNHLHRLGAVGRQEYLIVLYFRDSAEVGDILRASGIEPASVPVSSSTATAAADAARAELAALAAESAAIPEAGRGLASQRLMLYAVYDRLLLERQRVEAKALLGETARTFFITGWCPATRVAAVQQTLSRFEDSIAIEVRDPLPEEQPPVTLDNRKLSAPFEIVTNIYGWPSYREVDPTPVLAPFFALFFALALTDAGYGLVMAAYCYWMMRRASTPKHAHKFFRLIAIGGLVTVVIGALTGGWFGNALDYLPGWLAPVVRLKNSIMWFDPIKSPTLLMIISLVLGVIHLMAGIGVKMYRNIKDGHTVDALMDQGLWLVLLPSLGLMGAGSALGPGVAQGAKYAAMAAAAGLVLTQGRGAKNIVAKVFGGVYSLYGLIGYLSDTLSYTRLLALGLATGSLGMAINQIAMLVRPVPFVGIILMLLIMAIGHGVSLLINVFGAFIHSGRLQFVEFFTKFFEGGGKAFRPFAERPRYTEVTPD